MTRLLAMVITALCMPLSASAAGGFLYDCDMTGFEQGRGWISPKVAVVVKSDGTTQVVDAIGLHFEGGPVAAEVLRDNDQRFIVKWSIENARSDSGVSFSHFDYRASIAKKTGAIELTAIPRNFDTGVRSPGTCRIRRE